ncbi:MAG: methionine--tRNA ligase, partial [Candidatus Dormibacteria bacterium]
KYIEETAPWTLSSSSDPRLQTVCHELLEAVRVSTLLLAPFIPRAAAAVAADLGIDVRSDATTAVAGWDLLTPGQAVGVGPILFPRLNRDEVLDAE